MALITDPNKLPEPECRGGYPISQLEDIFDKAQLARLQNWMRGQTSMICEGKKFNHETREYEESCNGVSHGVVIYKHDLVRFIQGGPIID